MTTIALTIADLDNEILKQNPALGNYQDYQARRTRAYVETIASYEETLAEADDIFARSNTFAAPIAIGTAVVTTTTGDIYTVTLPTTARRVAGDSIMVSKVSSTDFVNVPRMAWASIVANGTGQTPYAFWEDNGQIVIYDKDGANFDNTSMVNFPFYRKFDVTVSVAPTPQPASAYAWTDVSGTTQTMAAGNAYIADNAALVTLTLPTTFAVGDRFLVAGHGAGGWKIAQNALEQVNFLIGNTTNGTGGYLQSTRITDMVELIATDHHTLQVVSAAGLVTNDAGAYVTPGPAAPSLDIKHVDFLEIVSTVLQSM